MDANHHLAEHRNIKWLYIIFWMMVTVQLGIIICYFQFGKEGFHSDEIWSYGYANSYYQKDIYQDEEGRLINVNEWLDTKVLKDYIVVNEGERFKYDSVYHNQIRDLSPPFHSMVLHTICSFFPGKFSRWFSFAINIASFLICMVYLYKTARLLKNDIFALCCCSLYGFSMGARDTYIYLRMYALCSALVMLYLYQVVSYLKISNADRKGAYRCLLKMSVIALIGFLTHYYMVSFVGLLTFFVCAYLLFKKQIKAMLLYGFSMLGTLIISVLLFPSMFSVSQNHTVDVQEVMDYNFEMRFRALLCFITKKLYNISVPLAKSGNWKIIAGCMVFLFILLLPLLFLLRNMSGVQSILKKIYYAWKNPKRVFVYLVSKTGWIYILLLLSAAGQMIVVGETSRVYGMGSQEDRYLFFLYPVAVIIGAAFIYWIIFSVVKKPVVKKVFLFGICIMLAGVNQLNCMHYRDYLFERGGEPDIEDVVKDRDCLIIRNQPWMFTTMVPTIMNAESFAVLDYKEYTNISQLYKAHQGGAQIVAVIDSTFKDSIIDALSGEPGIIIENSEEDKSLEEKKIYEDTIAMLEDLEPETKMEYITTQTIFSRPMEVYLINP